MVNRLALKSSAAKILILLSVSFSVTLLEGCFFFSTTPVAEQFKVPLPNDQSLDFTYNEEAKLLQSSNGASSLTGLKICGLKRAASLAARTRQLFVGFEDVSLTNSETLKFDGIAVLKTEIAATLDKVSLTAFTYSFTTNDCIFDLVLWGARDDQALANSTSPELQSAKGHLERALPAIIPAIVR